MQLWFIKEVSRPALDLNLAVPAEVAPTRPPSSLWARRTQEPGRFVDEILSARLLDVAFDLSRRLGMCFQVRREGRKIVPAWCELRVAAVLLRLRVRDPRAPRDTLAGHVFTRGTSSESGT